MTESEACFSESTPMRAVLVAAAGAVDMTLVAQRCPAARLPLVDRPFIQHVLERLVRFGFRDFDVILSQRPETVEGLLGDGTRWGCCIRYHLARDPQRPYGPLRFFQPADAPAPLLLVHADRLPDIDLSATAAAVGRQPCCLVVDNADEAAQWTGWAWLPSTWAPPADVQDLDAIGLEAVLMTDAETIRVPRTDGVETADRLLAAHRAFFEGKLNDLLVRGREVEAGIWLSRNVSLHPSASLQAPVYIAEDCRVGPGVTVGPYSVVGDHCVLDAGARIAESVVAPGSYVGAGVEIDRSFVDKNLMVNARLGSEILVTENFLLGAINEPLWKRWCLDRLQGLMALMLMALFLPLGLLVAVGCKLLRPGPLFARDEVLRLPAHADPSVWHTVRLRRFACLETMTQPRPGIGDLLLRFLPGLWDAVCGRLRLVGVPPRPPSAVRDLPDDWRAIYLSVRAGLITESMIRLGPGSPAEAHYAAETVYAASADIFHDLKLIGAYLAQCLHLLPAPDVTDAPETDGMDER